MKKIMSFFVIGMVTILLTGCSAKMFAILGALEAHEDRENKQGIEKQVSKLDSLSSTFSIAYKEGVIAYLTNFVGQVQFYNEKTQEKKTVQLPDGYESLQITAWETTIFMCDCYDGERGLSEIFADVYTSGIVKRLSCLFKWYWPPMELFLVIMTKRSHHRILMGSAGSAVIVIVILKLPII